MRAGEFRPPRLGAVLAAKPRAMTQERMRWYCDALETATLADGEFHIAKPNIHTDEDFARAQGLSGIIADGMISTNWISSLLIENFGEHYLYSGELTTKYVRPIYEDEIIQTYAEVTAVNRRDNATVYQLRVWCETNSGDIRTAGHATVIVED